MQQVVLLLNHEVLTFERKDIMHDITKCYRYSRGSPKHE